MSLREKINIAIPPTIKLWMNKFGHLANWSEVARRAIIREVRRIRRIIKAAKCCGADGKEKTYYSRKPKR